MENLHLHFLSKRKLKIWNNLIIGHIAMLMTDSISPISLSPIKPMHALAVRDSPRLDGWNIFLFEDHIWFHWPSSLTFKDFQKQEARNRKMRHIRPKYNPNYKLQSKRVRRNLIFVRTRKIIKVFVFTDSVQNYSWWRNNLLTLTPDSWLK